MRRKYKVVKIPLEAWEKLNQKRIKMEDAIKQVTHKPKRIYFTDFTSFISQKPTDFVYPEELVNYFTKRKTNKGGFLI